MIAYELWPVRVGGTYKCKGILLKRRVLTIVADDNHGGATVHYVYVNHLDEKLIKEPARSMSIATFCEMNEPEDESPIEDLLAALKALVQYEMPTGMANADATFVRWQAVVAAVIRAEK